MKTETFQDPSALMKRALFQSLAIGAVAVVLYMFCVEPCQTSLQKAKKEHVALQSQQAKMSLYSSPETRVSRAPSAEKLASRFSRLVYSKPMVLTECIREDAYHLRDL